MTKKDLKNIHKSKISYDTNKDLYYTYIVDKSKYRGRRMVTRRYKEDLIAYLYEYYCGKKERALNDLSFHNVFNMWIEEKKKYIKGTEKKASTSNTIIRYECDYRRFFKDTKFETLSIDKITKNDIEDICYNNLDRYDLRKRAFENLKIILKNTFRYAYEESYIQDNIYERVRFEKFKNMIADETPISERCHSEAEIKQILDELHEKQKIKPMYFSYYALELQILAGLRRGEIPPLRWIDIENNYLCIRREQITVGKSGSNFLIVNHTKTYKNRSFPITSDIADLLQRIKGAQETYYPKTEFLFPDNTKTGVITNRAAYLVYRKLCKKLGFANSKDTIKGPHSFRRNVITHFVNNSNGNIEMASTLFGNSPEVARGYYLTNVDISSAKEIMEKREFTSENTQK